MQSIIRLGILLGILILFFKFGYRIFVIDGESMSPFYSDKDIAVTNLLSYDFDEPKRFDVIMLRDRLEGDILVKRVVGMPNELIKIINGKIFINNEALIDPYYEQIFALNIEDILIPRDYYFYIGDNRGDSVWGIVRIDEIIGKVLY